MICNSRHINTTHYLAASCVLLFLCTSVQSQYYHNVKEYLFVNDYNLALSAFVGAVNENNSSASGRSVSPGATNTALSGNRVPGRNITIPTAPSTINRPDLQAAMKPDSVFLAPLNFADDKQIWIVEFVTGSCVGASFFTIRNKGTGKYLSLQYSCNLNVPANDISSCIDRTVPWVSLVLQHKSFEPPSGLCPQGTCISRFQKWRFGPIEEGMLSVHQNAFSLPYPGFLPGRTEFVSIKCFEITDAPPCKVSSGHREILYSPNRQRVVAAERMELNSFAVLSLNSKFRMVPNRPITMVKLTDYPWFICPKELLKGDRDFSGQPEMEIKFELTLNAARDRIIFNVSFKAEETKPDFSTTRLTWSRVVYNAPPGTRIKQIMGNLVWFYRLRTNINDESFKVNYPSDFLYSCEVIGDTLGDDISTDDNCNDDTRLGAFKFNRVAVIFE